MPFVDLDQLPKKYVTPEHSTAYGELVTGEQVELGRFSFQAGEGAKEHAHPHEQIVIVLSGRVRMTIGGDTRDLGPGSGFHAPSMVRHRLIALEESVVLSCKNIVGGAGHSSDRVQPEEMIAR